MNFSDLNWLGPRYKVKRFVASGGMGALFHAHDSHLGRDVAIKIIKNSSSDGYCEQALKEARILAQLNHPNILSVYDTISADQGSAVICEWLDGVSLAMFQKALDPMLVIAIMSQIFSGLAAAHDAGIFHRDIKPGNIILGSNGRITLIDFGVAFLTELASGNTLAGSLRYIDWRILEGQTPDAYSDIFSACLVMLELTKGGRVLPDLAPLPLHRYMKQQFKIDVSCLLKGMFPVVAYLSERYLVDRDINQRIMASKSPASSIAAYLGEVCLQIIKMDPSDYLRTYHPLREGIRYHWQDNFNRYSEQVIGASSTSAKEKLRWLSYLNHRKDHPGKILNRKLWPYLAIVMLLLVIPGDGQYVVELMKQGVNPTSPSNNVQLTEPQIEKRFEQEVVRTEIVDTQPPKIVKKSGPPKRLKKPADPPIIDTYITTDLWADLYIDGKKVVRLPSGKPIPLTQGGHRLSFHSPYIRSRVEWIDVSNAATRFTFKLEPKIVTVGIDIVSGDKPRIDGNAISKDQLGNMRLSVGKHRLSFLKGPRRVDVEFNVEPSENQIFKF